MVHCRPIPLHLPLNLLYICRKPPIFLYLLRARPCCLHALSTDTIFDKSDNTSRSQIGPSSGESIQFASADVSGGPPSPRCRPLCTVHSSCVVQVPDGQWPPASPRCCLGHHLLHVQDRVIADVVCAPEAPWFVATPARMPCSLALRRMKMNRTMVRYVDAWPCVNMLDAHGL